MAHMLKYWNRNMLRNAVLVSTLTMCCSITRAQAPAGTLGRHDSAARPVVMLPRPERLLVWSPQEKPVGFRNMEKISQVHEVKPGQSVFPLPYASKELTVSYSLNGQPVDTTTFMEQNDVAGLIVLRNGRILLERYALGFDEKSLWTSFSVAKSITSTLLGAAIADASIKGVDDAVTKYLPALKGSAYDGVSIRQVLNMTSGAKWNEDYSDPESDVNKCHRATDRSLGSPLLTYLAKLSREAAPGTKFVYKTAETDLIGEIVMAATGKPLAEYLSEKIWSKFGMERKAYWMLRGENELGGCCLSMSLRDYARFALFFLGSGMANGKQVLPVGWTKEAFAATDVSRDAIARNGGQGGYGYQWWVESDGPRTYAARGIFGQSIHLNPAESLIVVTLSAWPSPLDAKRRKATLAYQTAVTQAAHTGSSTSGSHRK